MVSLKIIYESDIKLFQEILLNWYSENGRDFIWRKKSTSNYEIIIAEVFLQRTKAETVSKFLMGFYKRYPSWNKLGDATLEELQDFVKPLGLYKQRGTRIYKLAQELKKRNGRFPKERSEVEEMPMMGQYITNAYELYVLKKNSPLIDVNMARLLERYFGPRRLADIRYDPYLQSLAWRIVNVKKSKEINWAILDFAAMICKQRIPLCNRCVLNNNCKYYESIISTKPKRE